MRQYMDTSPNTFPNVVDETTNSHVNIEDKEIELFVIASRHLNSKIKIVAKMRFLRWSKTL